MTRQSPSYRLFAAGSRLRRRNPAFSAALSLSLVTLLLCSAPAADGATAIKQNGRISLNGYTSDWDPGEALFGLNDSLNVAEESDVDSRWQDSDISQIFFTWDADSVYFAGAGVISGNNMIILFDVGNPNPGILASTGTEFDGLADMTQLNSWRRNFVFTTGFRPDIFGATWDNNTAPRFLSATGPNQVLDEQPIGSATGTGAFRSVASFQGTQTGRAMEFSVPWWKFLDFSAVTGLDRRYVPELGDTVTVLPEGVRYIKVVGVVTAGGDGTGGPDSAPDNLGGHEVDGGIQVTIDNWAIIDIDAVDNVTGAAGPDGLPDFDINPKDRTRFVVRPPVTPLRFEFQRFDFDRPYFAPDRGEQVRFTFDLKPRLPESQAFRKVQLSAGVYDMRGRLVRRLYTKDSPDNPPRLAIDPVNPDIDLWDGRDADGRIVDGGLYLLRMVVEPDLVRLIKPVGVVR